MRSLVDAGLWHGGKPVWCNYRESLQLHWGNLPVICQWLRYSITSKPCTSAPGHKIKPKRTPHAIVTTLIVTTISFREEDAGLNSARMFILIPQHMKTSELLFIFTVKRLTILSSSKMTGIQPVCVRNEWPNWPLQSPSHHKFSMIRWIFNLTPLMLLCDSDNTQNPERGSLTY